MITCNLWDYNQNSDYYSKTQLLSDYYSKIVMHYKWLITCLIIITLHSFINYTIEKAITLLINFYVAF